MRTIDSVFKAAFDKVAGIRSFGIGPKPYANILEGSTPRVWVHRITSIDNVGASGAIETTYSVLLDISTQCDYTADLNVMRDLMQTIDALWVKYLDAICQDNKLAAYPVNIRREEHYHELDANLLGFAVSMEVKLKEGLAYFCESGDASYYESGYIADGYYVKE